MPLPNLTLERQCEAKSKRTGLPCNNLAAYGCTTCRMHRAHKSRNAASGLDHYNYKDGKATQAARAEYALKSAELHQLVDLGNAIGLFDGVVKLRGRRPKPPSSWPSSA